MTAVSDYIRRTERASLEDWDERLLLLLEQDRFVSISVRLNPVRTLIPDFVVRFVRDDEEVVVRATGSFKKAFQWYREAIEFQDLAGQAV